jgi:hypothetical protein
MTKTASHPNSTCSEEELMAAKDFYDAISGYTYRAQQRHRELYENCNYGTPKEKKLLQEMTSAWKELRDIEGQTYLRELLRSAVTGVYKGPSFFTHLHRELRQTIAQTRQEIYQRTIDLLGRRLDFNPIQEKEAVDELVLHLGRLFLVETTIPQERENIWDAEDFIGCAVKVGIEYSTPQGNGWEYVWINQVQEAPPNDRDEPLGGHIAHVTWQLPEFLKGQYVTFKVSEIQDCIEPLDRESSVREVCIAAIERLLVGSNSDGRSEQIWLNLSHRERQHVVEFDEEWWRMK